LAFQVFGLPENAPYTRFPWKVWFAVSLIQVFSGLSLIVFGRKIFWLIAGAIGFYVTFGLAARFFQEQPEWLILLIAATVGLAGAMLAVFVQSLAVGIISFLAGGYFLSNLLELAGLSLGPFGWFVFSAGGLAAAFLAIFLFEWALIVLSSFSGASLVIQAAALEQEVSALVFFTLFLLGIGLQVGLLRWEDQKQGVK
jgi:hypothetical protein